MKSSTVRSAAVLSTDAAAPSASTPVPIVGMHRSGTSMVAKLLHRAGLNLGAAEDLMPPAEENPEGFFEHLAFVRLNEEVLNAAGAGWDCPPPADTVWDDERFQAFRDRARLLAVTMASDGPWGWKDPRTTLTLPFWRSALGPLKAVVVVRNPLEVITSLHRRNGFSIALSLTLWRIYAERVFQDTAEAERLVTHYDAYFLEPAREIERVLHFVGLEPERDTAALETAPVTGLRHHRRTTQDLITHGFPPEVIELYRRLCREAAWWEGNGSPAEVNSQPFVAGTHGADSISRGTGWVDLIRVENEALRRNNADFAAAIADREARVAELELAVRRHEASRAELEANIHERDLKVHERNSLIARRDNATQCNGAAARAQHC